MTDHFAKQILDQVVTTCTGRRRTRFIKELERMSEMDYCAIVIESSFSSFTKPPLFSRMNPHSAIMSLVAWSIRYVVCIYFADKRAYGNWLTFRILEKFWKEKIHE